MKKNLAYILSLFAFTTLAACGGDDSVTDPDSDPIPDDDTQEEVDTTAPTIVSTSPATGAVGQSADTTVSITFSEPMDKESVENTLDASDLGDVTISWNQAGDTITITPNAPLEYAFGIGDDPTVVDANQYVVNLGSAALDVAGNGLGTGTQIIFYTLKEMAITFEPNAEMTRSMTPEALLYAVDDPLAVGDTADDNGIRTGITFDIADLPDSAVAISSATLATRQLPGDTLGTPYEDLGDSVLLDHVTFGPLDSELAINYAFNSNQSSMSSHENFCIDGQVIIEFDVTDELDDDLLNRSDRDDLSQYLLRFALGNNQDAGNDRAVFSRELMELQVSYLAP